MSNDKKLLLVGAYTLNTILMFFCGTWAASTKVTPIHFKNLSDGIYQKTDAHGYFLHKVEGNHYHLLWVNDYEYGASKLPDTFELIDGNVYERKIVRQ